MDPATIAMIGLPLLTQMLGGQQGQQQGQPKAGYGQMGGQGLAGMFPQGGYGMIPKIGGVESPTPMLGALGLGVTPQALGWMMGKGFYGMDKR